MKTKVNLLLFLISCVSATYGQADMKSYLNEVKQELQKVWPSNRTVNFVFHGHSVPSGYFKTPDVRTLQAYPHQTLEQIKAQYPLAVVNSIVTAIGGEQSESGAKRFEADVLTHKPDVLFIDYALNDRGLGLERAKAAWEQMIKKALELNIKVILLTPTPDWTVDILDENSPLEQHSRQIRELAAKYGVGLVDSYAAFKDLVGKGNRIETYMSQINHPNRQGHLVVTNLIMKWLTDEKQPQNESAVTAYLSGNPHPEALGSGLTMDNLRCEYLQNPLGIDVVNPRFSWELLSAGTDKKQKAYRILVATDIEILTEGKADVWDSKKTNSNASNQIIYAGKPLKANTLYYWKACVWDEKGKQSEWSPAAHFFVGPLTASDWQAWWIGEREYPVHQDDSYYPYNGFVSAPVKDADAKRWLLIDLGKVQPLDVLKIHPVYKRERAFPIRFTVEIASNADFSDSQVIVNETDNDITIQPAEFYYKKFDKPLNGRYLRLNVLKSSKTRNDRYEYGIAEFEALYDMENKALYQHVALSDTSFAMYGWQFKFPSDGALVTDGFVKPNNLYHLYDMKMPPSPMIRKEFVIRKKIRNAFLTASSKGIYELYMNGEKVGKNIFAPEFTSYDKHLQHQTYDVSGLLKEGGNAIGVMLADGWYAGPRHLAPGRGGYGLFRQFLGQLLIIYEDGTKETIATDYSWKFRQQSPVTEASFFNGEVYEADKEQNGWTKPEFNDSGWDEPATYPVGASPLCAQMNEPVSVIKELKPVSVHKSGRNKYIFDLGQNMVGWCRLKIPYNPERPVRLRYGEMIYDDGTLYTDNLRDAKPVDVYIPANETAIDYEPRFTYHGFRYVEVEGLTEKPDIEIITGKVTASASPVTGYFETSDKDINKLWENIRWTQWGNQISIPTDCPQRDERLGWMADAQVFSQNAIYNLDMAGFYTKFLRDIRDSQLEDGRFTDISPFDGLWKCFYNGPGWADAGVVIPWQLYRNYNDKRILQVQYEAIKKFVDFNHAHNQDFIWRNVRGNDYGDWLNGNTIVSVPDYPKTGAQMDKEAFSTAYFALSTEILAQSARLLGKESDFKYYGNLAASIRKAFVNEYVASDGKIKDDTQASYAIALQFNLLPQELRAKAASHMAEAVKKYDYRLSTGFHSTICLMKQLCEYGYTDIAYRLLTSRRFPSWFYSIDQGATTVWERWDGYVAGRGFQDPSMNSFNHVALGAVGEWMYSHILGIRPDDSQPGFRQFVIKPCPGDILTWAKGSYHSINGMIEVSWTKTDGVFKLEVSVPANTTATVILPDNKQYKVGSGHHRF
jgi:alpha-L-rhamnosidase